MDHSHVFWLCPKITTFWDDIHLITCRILGYDVSKSCKLLYLGIILGNVLKDDKYILKIILVACKKAITRKWYKADPPTQEDWRKIMDEIHTMEQLTHKIRTQEDQCRRKWEKWTKYIKTTGQGPMH